VTSSALGFDQQKAPAEAGSAKQACRVIC